MNFKSGYGELQALKIKIDELKKEVGKTFFLSFIKRFFINEEIKKYSLLYKKLKKELFEELDNHLKSEMPVYYDTLKENHFLLTKTDFTMQVHTITSDMVGSTELKFTGAISPKGYLYLDVKKTDFVTGMFIQGRMSKQFQGKFDEYGSYSADSTSMTYNVILPRIPKYFVARGFDDYSFKMDAVETEWEISDKNHVGRMIGDPFHSNHSDRQKFIKNRVALLDMKAKFLKSLE